jgi:Zn-dependent oligopeptidase
LQRAQKAALDAKEAELAHMTEKFERNSIAAGEYSLEVERLRAELADVKEFIERITGVKEYESWCVFKEQLTAANKKVEVLEDEVFKLGLQKDPVVIDAVKDLSIAHMKQVIQRIRANRDEITEQLAASREAFENLVSLLPEECTAGFVTHARAIASGIQADIERTK